MKSCNRHPDAGNEIPSVQFFTRHPELFLKDLQRCYPLNEDHIGAFTDRENWDWDWVQISRNPNVLWTKELIESYADYWDWSALSTNTGLEWTIDLVEYFANLWDWRKLSENNSLPWSIEFCDRFAHQINWRVVRLHEPWTIEFLEKYEDRFDWTWLSGFDLSWDAALINRFLGKWDWRSLSTNRSIPWSSEIIDRFTDRWFWDSLEFVLPYELRLKYGCKNQDAPYAPPWTVEKMVMAEQCENGWMSLQYEGLTLELIEEYQDRWDWEVLSNNNRLDDTDLWPIGIFDICQSRWHWGAVSVQFPHDVETIEKHKDKWDWFWLSQNWSLPWSVDFIKQYEERWDFAKVGEHLQITKDTLTETQVNNLLREIWMKFDGHDDLVLSHQWNQHSPKKSVVSTSSVSHTLSIQPIDASVAIPQNITIQGQKFDLVGIRPYTKKDGTASQILAWESQCTVCGSTYDYTSPTVIDRSKFTRTCPSHRQPGKKLPKK